MSLAILAPGTADTCPVCQRDHKAMDPFWTCPEHRHQLKFFRRDGELEVFRCPARKCQHERTAPPKPRSPSQGDPMTTVQTRPTVAVDTMWANAKRLQALLPGIEVNLFIASAASALYNNADLMAAAEANPASLMIALTDAASLGHLPGSKEYYLTPRKDHGKPVILGIEGYRGVVERFYRSGEVAKVVVREVCAKDYFRFVEGEDEHPIHRFGSTDGTSGADFFGETGHVDRGAMVGVYCAVQGTDGRWYRPAILSRDDVHAARDAGGYKAADPYSPWNRYDAGRDQPGFQGRSMWWKTAAKRAEPWTPTSSEDKRQVQRAVARLRAEALSGPPPSPALPHAGARENGRQAVAQAPAQAIEGGVTVAEAIRKEFDRLGLEDAEERTVCVAKLANKEPGFPLAELTERELRFVLDSLKYNPETGDGCEDLAALIDLCAAEAS